MLTTTAGTHAGAFTPLDWGLFLSIGCIWGSSFLLIAIGLDAFEPGLVTWLRIIFGASVLWLVPAARHAGSTARTCPRLVAISVLWVAIPFTLFPFAEQRITSGLTGLVNGALPDLRGRHRLADAAAAARAGAGAGARRGLPRRRGHRGCPRSARDRARRSASLMALVATLCYGFAINIATPLTQRYGSLPVMARMLGLASIWTAPLGLLSIPGSDVRLALVRGRRVLWASWAPGSRSS